MQNTQKNKLNEVVEILNYRKPEIDNYYEESMFKPMGIKSNCFVEKDMKSVRRLFEFSLTTRQGGTTKKTTDKYKKVGNKVDGLLKEITDILSDKNINPKKRYEGAFFKLLNSEIEGMNQKIISMFLKFLIYHSSKNFDGKSELDDALFIPLDVHVLRFLFKKVNKEKEKDMIQLFDGDFWQSIWQSSLHLPRDITKIDNKKNFKIQNKIQNEFKEAKITEPPIILDYLWYIGTMYCRYRNLPKLGCDICWLRDLCSSRESKDDKDNNKPENQP
ncbi:hypothetical protein BEH94_03235 [Candidatus Altiarchaeales archaeon WOR_SM1_SCG]|nr:hypothetical protein BEH94_03235 [Candidatus Altiarchaeales archaeon WOR_SM1_SCG]